jgi:hypothetical protein
MNLPFGFLATNSTSLLYTGDYTLEGIATTINPGTYGYERQGMNTVPEYSSFWGRRSAFLGELL